MEEPGLDLHEWQTRWGELEDLTADSPDEALPEMVALVEEMLVERGFEADEPVTAGGEDPEIVKQFLAAREGSRLAEEGLATPEDVETAVDDLRSIFEFLVTDRAAP